MTKTLLDSVDIKHVRHFLRHSEEQSDEESRFKGRSFALAQDDVTELEQMSTKPN